MKSPIIKHMQAFGTLKGAEIYYKGKYQRGEHAFTIPGLKGSLLLRGKTSDRFVFRKVFVSREYHLDLGFTPRTILDGGANVGYSTVFFAQQFPSAVIVAVEPDPENFRLLSHNTTNYPNIHLVNKALWPHKTHLAIENPAGQTDSFRVGEFCGTTTIPTCTITELLREIGADTFDLIKLDVEGAEKELFEAQDREEWLAQSSAIVFESHDRFKPGCTESVENAVAGKNFARSKSGENILFVRKPPTLTGARP